MAMLFGKDGKPAQGETVPADMADAGGANPAAVPAGTVQTAAREIGTTAAEASEMHADCRG
jgi:hypothetical protein